MAKKGANEIVGLVCSVCKNQNYVTTRNKTNLEVKVGSTAQAGKLTLKKYCKHCKKYQVHKETIKLK